MELRPYQREAVVAVEDFWRAGGGHPIVEVATGGGKSLIAATIMRRAATLGARVACITHVRELVRQNATALVRSWPDVPLGIHSAGLDRRDVHQPVILGSIQSMYRKASQIGPFDVVLVDEAHLIPNRRIGMYRTFIADLMARTPELRVVGLTATPFRLDDGPLVGQPDSLFDEIVYRYTISRGIAEGYLSPLVAKQGSDEGQIDVTGLRRRGSDYVESDLQEAADRDELVRAAVEEIIALGRDRRAWIVFCAGVEHARHVTQALCARGIAAETIVGTAVKQARDDAVKRFKAGTLRCLVGVGVLTTGFDAPHVDLLAMLRPTQSLGLYLQMIGRGTRCAPSKDNCLVLDFSGNVARHGPIDATNAPQPQDRGTDQQRAPTPRAHVCPGCFLIHPTSVRVCPDCGEEIRPREEERPRHAASASTTPIMLGVHELPWRDVSGVQFGKHIKAGRPPSLVVQYRIGFEIVREWVCIEHPGKAQFMARAWWSAVVGEIMPLTVDAAVNLPPPPVVAVRVANVGRYKEVVGWRVRRIDGTIVEIDKSFAVSPVEAAA